MFEKLIKLMKICLLYFINLKDDLVENFIVSVLLVDLLFIGEGFLFYFLMV